MKENLAKIKILSEGYFRNVSKTKCRASSSIVLIQDASENIIVDTGNFVDAKKILVNLKKLGLSPEDINIVINTHFHPDHVGCNFLFKKARFLTLGVAFWDDIFDRSAKAQRLTSNVSLMATPGHSEDSLIVLVRSEMGQVAITGDLFWSEHDEKIKLLEEDCSDKRLFYKNREKIRKIVQWIIPGHGKMFKT